MPSAGSLNPHADLRLVLRARFPQDHHRAQRLGIQPGHQIDVLGTVLLPKLANLYLGNAHKADFDSRVPRKHCQLRLSVVSMRTKTLPVSPPPPSRSYPSTPTFKISRTVPLRRKPYRIV